MARERQILIAFRVKEAEKTAYRFAAQVTPGGDSMSAWIRGVLNREALRLMEESPLETTEYVDPSQQDLLEDEATDEAEQGAAEHAGT